MGDLSIIRSREGEVLGVLVGNCYQKQAILDTLFHANPFLEVTHIANPADHPVNDIVSRIKAL